jgi:hypothetical protein
VVDAKEIMQSFEGATFEMSDTLADAEIVFFDAI